MKTKIVVAFFSLIAFGLVVFLALNRMFFSDKNAPVRPQIVTPVAPSDTEGSSGDGNAYGEGGAQTSFVPLLPTETLISTLTVDFDGDAFDDQIIAVRKAGFPYLFLIVGLYNAESNTYERSAEITTEISKTRTFSYNGIDMIGDHRMALVYQGVKSDGDQVLKMFLCRRRRGNVELVNIGSFSSDGTIFIQQTERSEAYELSQAQGKNYTVWVYSSDRSEEQSSSVGITQVQTEYSWNSEKGMYVQTNQVRVTGNRLAAKELSRIQNGNVETFAQFLSGFWYKASTDSANPNYIYFDYENKEVILLSDDTEGVYSWEDSSLRRSGIYLSTVNSIIASMKRRFDIMLTGVNEVFIHVRDDVGNMVIKESNQWDGTYRKMSFQNVFGDAQKSPVSDEFEKVLTQQKTWLDDDRNVYTFEHNGYRIQTSEGEETGIYVISTVASFPVIQFRSRGETSFLGKAYAMRFRTEETVVPARGRNQKQTVETKVFKDGLTLSPVRIAPDTVFAAEGKRLSFRKGEN